MRSCDADNAQGAEQHSNSCNSTPETHSCSASSRGYVVHFKLLLLLLLILLPSLRRPLLRMLSASLYRLHIRIATNTAPPTLLLPSSAILLLTTIINS
jgi:hypothetical protein